MRAPQSTLRKPWARKMEAEMIPAFLRRYQMMSGDLRSYHKFTGKTKVTVLSNPESPFKVYVLRVTESWNFYPDGHLGTDGGCSPPERSLLPTPPAGLPGSHCTASPHLVIPLSRRKSWDKEDKRLESNTHRFHTRCSRRTACFPRSISFPHPHTLQGRP